MSAVQQQTSIGPYGEKSRMDYQEHKWEREGSRRYRDRFDDSWGCVDCCGRCSWRWWAKMGWFLEKPREARCRDTSHTVAFCFHSDRQPARFKALSRHAGAGPPPGATRPYANRPEIQIKGQQRNHTREITAWSEFVVKSCGMISRPLCEIILFVTFHRDCYETITPPEARPQQSQGRRKGWPCAIAEALSVGDEAA